MHKIEMEYVVGLAAGRWLAEGRSRKGRRSLSKVIMQVCDDGAAATPSAADVAIMCDDLYTLLTAMSKSRRCPTPACVMSHVDTLRGEYGDDAGITVEITEGGTVCIVTVRVVEREALSPLGGLTSPLSRWLLTYITDGCELVVVEARCHGKSTTLAVADRLGADIV